MQLFPFFFFLKHLLTYVYAKLYFESITKQVITSNKMTGDICEHTVYQKDIRSTLSFLELWISACSDGISFLCNKERVK